MRFTALCVGLILITIDQTASFSRIPLHGATRSVASDGGLRVLPPWSEFATIAAQLSIVTPAVIQMYYFKKQIDVLGDRFEKLESEKSQSLETTAKEGSMVEGFTKDMKEALAAYKELYGSMSEQIDTILTNEEKRLTFEGDLVDSISELQVLSTDVSELKIENKALRSILESASQSQKASTDYIKKQQGKRVYNLHRSCVDMIIYYFRSTVSQSTLTTLVNNDLFLILQHFKCIQSVKYALHGNYCIRCHRQTSLYYSSHFSLLFAFYIIIFHLFISLIFHLYSLSPTSQPRPSIRLRR